MFIATRPLGLQGAEAGSDPASELAGTRAGAREALGNPVTDGGYSLWQGASFLDRMTVTGGRQEETFLPVDPGLTDFTLARALERMAVSGDGRAATSAPSAEGGGFHTLASFPAVVELSGINGTNGYVFSGPGPGQRSGYRVAAAEDVNGDGVADIVIGGGNGFVVFGGLANLAALDALDGSVDGRIEPTSLDGANGFRLSGMTSFNVSSAGDINGDGFADVFVSNYGASPNGLSSGAGYLVYGKSGGFSADVDLTALNGTDGFQLAGVAAGNQTGYSCDSAGDINGDGLDDMIIGANFASPNGTYSGASYVVFGKASSFGASFDLSTLNGTNGFKLSGVNVRDEAGLSVSAAGDINGDGFADIFVGAPLADPNGDKSGQAYVVFGKAGGFAANLDLSTLNGTNGFTLSGGAQNDSSGRRVNNAGDVNGDGFDDMVISGGGNGMNAPAYLVFGKATPFAANLNLAAMTATDGFRITGIGNNTTPISSAGDVNGDGFDDILIGNLGGSANGAYAGIAYVIYGKATSAMGGFGASIDVSTLNGTNGFILNGVNQFDQAGGRGVSSAGDVNGDGLDDLLIGGFGADPNGGESGETYLVYGRMPDTAVTLTGTAAGQTLVGSLFADTFLNVGLGDSVYANGGNDLIKFNFSDTGLTVNGSMTGVVMDGGDGIDTLDFRQLNGCVSIDLETGELRAGGSTGIIIGVVAAAAFENVTGSNFGDMIVGSDMANTLNGGKGNDMIVGGLGNDRLIGGRGNDVFVFGSVNDSLKGMQDQIVDFARGDRIDLSGIDANMALVGDQRFHLGGDGAHAGDIMISYNAAKNVTVLNLHVDDNDTVDAVIWLSGNHTNLTANDIWF
ncbi:MAG: M10 family metallopeptidase C-terminal domain-containing protein [Caulobacter sp.]|nr:M10 family metallopeptidase C-terminal domain-containing protein [Caulobacter sp.]